MMPTPVIHGAGRKRRERTTGSDLAAVIEMLRTLVDDMERLADAPLPSGKDAQLLADTVNDIENSLQELRLLLKTRSGNDWRFGVLKMLGAQSTRRVMRAKEFDNLIREMRPGVSARGARQVLHDMRAAGALLRVTRGLYVNKRASPPVNVFEAAQHLRVGAVISLHSVLDEVGFLRGPTNVTVAVVPAVSERSSFEAVKTQEGSRFWFYQLHQRFFRTGPPSGNDVYGDFGEHPAFRAEAALLQWLHLASVGRRSLVPPPLDVDMSALELKVLKRLAHHWLLLGNLTAYLSSVAAYEARPPRRRSNKA
jgi:hypothetical protein